MAGPGRRRADLVLVERGHFESRARARAAIEAGLVRVGGETVRRASDLVAEDAAIEAEPPHPYVSRGGLKLAAALDAFAIDPAGRECLDLGASTGGFTEVLLARGAARVHAVDVGRGQLHPRIAADPRVVSLEATDARALGGILTPGSIALATFDLSFISLRLVLPAIAPLLAPGARLVVLVKPQFEVGRDGVGRGGLVRDEALHRKALEDVADSVRSLGLGLIGTIDSPIEGGSGNREYLIGAALPP